MIKQIRTYLVFGVPQRQEMHGCGWLDLFSSIWVSKKMWAIWVWPIKAHKSSYSMDAKGSKAERGGSDLSFLEVMDL